MRILTANIYNYAADYARRGPVLREALLRLDCDVMAFQEAGRRADAPHQVEELLDGQGFHLAHQFDGAPIETGDDGVCIASRWPITVRECQSLPRSERTGTYPWAALAVTVHAPAPIGDFLFVNAKPCWQLHMEAERETQVVAMLEMIAHHAEPTGFPTVIAGDFDAAPDRSSIRFLTGRQSLQGQSTQYHDAWETAGQPTADNPDGCTWCCENPLVGDVALRWTGQRRHRRRIDYIFVGSPFLFQRLARITACRVVLNEPIGGVWPSDHYGVMAEIEPG